MELYNIRSRGGRIRRYFFVYDVVVDATLTKKIDIRGGGWKRRRRRREKAKKEREERRRGEEGEGKEGGGVLENCGKGSVEW